jgi:hypothetical protein
MSGKEDEENRNPEAVAEKLQVRRKSVDRKSISKKQKKQPQENVSVKVSRPPLAFWGLCYDFKKKLPKRGVFS